MDAPTPASLADRLVADAFGVKDGVLQVGGVDVRDLAARHGTPLYVYDASIARGRLAALRRAVAGFAEVFYSIKANPALAPLFAAEGLGLEVASGAEFLLARAAGVPAERILFAGPGKSAPELALAIGHGIGEIHLESFDEIEMVADLGRAADRRVPVSIRVNPGSAALGGAMRMGGKPTAFGFDEEMLAEVTAAVEARPELDLGGLHLFAGTQILDAAVLLDQWAYGLDLSERLASLIGRPLKAVDLGGGLGIPYHPGDATLDLTRVTDGAAALVRRIAASPALKSARILVEPGRFLAGPAGVYLVAVRTVKTSRGQRFLVTDGGMHHQLAASGNLGQVIKRDFPIIAATRMGAPAMDGTQVVGPLCTPLDTLGRQTALPEVARGDLIAVLQSGAYGLSSSPVGFLGHPMPAEILVDGGQVTLLRPAGRFEAPLVNLALTVA